MNHTQQQRLLDFLKQEFDPDNTIHFLAIAAAEQQQDEPSPVTTFKVRVALTFQDGSTVNPCFDGTDLLVAITPTDIKFTQEDGWAEGPPIREGSPLELAFGWVSELAPPFFVSPHAKAAAERGATHLANKQAPTSLSDTDPWF